MFLKRELRRQILLIFVSELFVLFCITDAQTTNTSLFVFADLSPTLADSTAKVFTTGVNLVPNTSNQSDFNESAFLNASTAFYTNAFTGFSSVAVLSASMNGVTNQNVESFDVVYEVSYNYAAFSTQAANDTIVLSRIGSLDAVKSGLEASLQGIYNVSSTSSLFSFTGNLLCPSATCVSEYVPCTESSLGLSLVCRSVCFSTFVCHNDGTCVHRQVSSPPTCNCVASSTVWYLGGRCEYKVEAWMIAVFVVGFIAIIFLIILIGCICCRRKSKLHDRNYMGAELVRKQIPEPKVNSSSANKHRPREDSQDSVIERDPMPLSQATPLTSNALVTVQQSSEESDGSSETLEMRADGPRQTSAEPGSISVVEASDNQAASPGGLSDDSSTSAEEQNSPFHAATTGISPQSSVADSEAHDRRYNSLLFPDSQQKDAEVVNGEYDTLDATRNRGTQTNTRINIELPESILMNKI